MTDEMVDVYNKLSKGDFVTTYFGDCISNGRCTTLIVTSGPRTVKCSWAKGGRISRIILKNPDNLGGVRYTLRNDDGRVSLSVGDMATILFRLDYGKGNN
tara:strand:- start:422 stop:721 length:300 start_codon:yes stop_codon:yes gene_type:complete